MKQNRWQSNKETSKPRSNKPRPESWNIGDGEKDKSKIFCSFHNRGGHTTQQCFGFQNFVYSKFHEEGLAQIEVSLPINNNNTSAPKRNREAKSTEAPGPLTSRKRTNMIMRGNPFSDDSVRAIKDYGNRVISVSTRARDMIKDDAIIKFIE